MLSYRNLMRLDQILTDKRTPKQTKVITGSRLMDTKVIPAGRIAYVGDSVTMDIGGARAAGLHPILLDPHDDHLGADFDRIGSLMELIG